MRRLSSVGSDTGPPKNGERGNALWGGGKRWSTTVQLEPLSEGESDELLTSLLGQAQVTAIVVGPRRPEHLEPALAALHLDLSPADRDRIGAFFP